MSSYDFGFVSTPDKGRGLKVTVNKFRDQWYVHIREYMEDEDEGSWFPTKKGISIKAEYIDVLCNMLQDSSNLLTQIYFDEVLEILPEKQLNLFKDEY